MEHIKEKQNILKKIFEIGKNQKSFSSSEIHYFFQNVTRQYISQILKKLSSEGKIEKKGHGRYTQYKLLDNYVSRTYTFAVDDYRGEDMMFSFIKGKELWISELNEKSYNKLSYIITEMMNNVIDHSGSKKLDVSIADTKNIIFVSVYDKGIGIFEKIKNVFKLKNHREALSKIMEGKTTSDKKNHSGEGIFFSSKVADKFIIHSGKINVHFDNIKDDVFLEEVPYLLGTKISFEIDIRNEKTILDTFKQYTNNNHVFDTTKIIVELSQTEGSFVSRSEAKRMVHQLAEKFQHIIFDYRDVRTVGQGFADEIYHVFADNHPDIKIDSINMNPDVEFMVLRAQ